jgi:hypothetical protein
MSECILWQRTRDLAKDYGHEMSAKCPMESVCKGTTCTFLEPMTKTVDDMSVFYEKLEKGQTKQRLAQLRQELKTYTPQDTFKYEL